MSFVIDMARHIARKNPKKKEYLFQWPAMFSQWDTFVSLWEECVHADTVIPEAAKLADEYQPPKPEPTPEEKARAAEEKARLDAEWKEIESRAREKAAKGKAAKELLALPFIPLAGYRSGLRIIVPGSAHLVCSAFRLWSASVALPTA